MVEKNKVVIKINYQGSGKSIDDIPQQKMVTEWHVQRILTAVILLVFVILLFYYFFFVKLTKKESIKNIEITNLKNNVKPVVNINRPRSTRNIKTPSPEKVGKNEGGNHAKTYGTTNSPPGNSKKTAINKTVDIIDKDQQNINAKSVANIKPKDKKDSELTPLSVISTDKRITRALLTSEVIDREPIDKLTKQISVNKHMATRVFYFTEISNMKDQYLFHHWLRNDELVFERKINIKGYKWRASTSKLITYSQSGFWKVRLIDKDGLVLNEIQFKAVKQ